jgi:hypothetical protein
MNIFGTPAPVEQRLVSVICAIKEHDYCLREKNVACTCSCHYAADWIVEGDSLVDFAFKLWEIAGALPKMKRISRDKIILDLIISAEGTVNFEGLKPTEIANLLSVPLSRDYWSARETKNFLGLGEN